MYKYGLFASLMFTLPACGVAPADSPPPGVISRAVAHPGDIQPSPSSVFFGQLCPGDFSVRTLTLFNRSPNDHFINDISLNGQAFSLLGIPALPYFLGPNASVNVTLGFSPANNRLAPYLGTLTVSSDDPVNPDLPIGVEGLVLPGSVSINPRQFDFGDVTSGFSRTTTLHLTNTSQCQVQVARATVQNGSSFAVLTVGALPPNPLQNGDSASVTLRLDCNDVDDLDATVRFYDASGRSLGSTNILGSCI